MNVLLIYENENTIEEIEKLIRICYPQDCIVTFSCAKEALDYMDNSAGVIDLCFTQVVMQGISGFRICEIIRRKNKQARVVLLARDANYALEGWRYGMNDYLIEPITRDSIEHTLISCAL